MKKIFLLSLSLILIAPLFSQQKPNDEFINKVKNQIESIKATLPAEKNPVPTYIKIAELYISIDDTDSAIGYLEMAKSVEPENSHVYYLAAMCYEKNKNFQRAVENWELCLKYSDSPQMNEIAKKHIKYLKEIK